MAEHPLVERVRDAIVREEWPGHWRDLTAEQQAVYTAQTRAAIRAVLTWNIDRKTAGPVQNLERADAPSFDPKEEWQEVNAALLRDIEGK